MEQVIKELIVDRRYDINSLEINENVYSVNHNTNKCIILNEMDTKIRKNNIVDVINEYELEDYDKLILILTSKLNNTKDIHPNIQIFIKPLINITKHKYVPKHTLLTTDEITTLKDTGIEINKLPLILRIDPVIKWYDFKSGGVCKIIRSNQSIYHRLIK